MSRSLFEEVSGVENIPHLDSIIFGLPELYRNTHLGRKAINYALKDLANLQWINLSLKKVGKCSDHHIPLNPRKAN